eukprot:TRINITY_DN1819_c0_g1_i3.p1 TRINITY_DN1819_c0_g1~~TRINITY_DN1819_c0_g1_i3.p1  ORF type:complete len:478 (-),score=112.53 TRINITY_DN1819_c0_g1_i3:136-1569(-)
MSGTILCLEDLFVRDVPLYPYLMPVELVSVAHLSKKYRDIINGADRMWKNLTRNIFQVNKKLPAKTWKETFAHAWTQDMRLRRENDEEIKANGGRPIRPWGGCRPPTQAPSCPQRVLPEVQDPYQPIQGFRQHPNSSSNPVVQFSEHLSRHNAMQDFLSFGEKFFAIKPNLAANALMRYKCFMYLHKLYPDSLFVPTLDIEFVWRIHCTRPFKYKQDCEANVGKIISHIVYPSVALRELRQQALQLTNDLWKTHFKVDYIKDFAAANHNKMTQELDIGVWHEEVLMWSDAPKEEKLDVQISLASKEILDEYEWFQQVQHAAQHNPLHKGLKLWSSLLKSYERYLFMYLITRQEDLANPSLLIDLAWHTHMIDPEAYISDMMKIVGEVLDHDPTVKQDNTRVAATSKAWEEQFGAKYEEEHQFVRHLPGETVHAASYGSGRRFAPHFNPVAAIANPRPAAAPSKGEAPSLPRLGIPRR